jgi:uncharacterized protein (TIGR02246 family)
MTTVEQRLQRLEDRDAIHQIFIDYGRHLDQGDWDSYAALFAEDGEVLLGPMGRAKGRDAIRELMATTLTPGLGTSYHLISSPAVSIDGDSATAEVMWTVLQRGEDGGPVVTMLGKHLDQLSRVEGGWVIQRRAGHVTLAAGMPSR